jgi:hypothetical protein
MQACRKCGATKAAADFPLKRAHPDGRDDYCKGCHAAATAARVAARGPVKEPTVGSKARVFLDPIYSSLPLPIGTVGSPCSR